MSYINWEEILKEKGISIYTAALLCKTDVYDLRHLMALANKDKHNFAIKRGLISILAPDLLQKFPVEPVVVSTGIASCEVCGVEIIRDDVYDPNKQYYYYRMREKGSFWFEKEDKTRVRCSNCADALFQDENER